MSRTNGQGARDERRIRVHGVPKNPPDLRKLARALILLAQAEADAQAQAEGEEPKRPTRQPREGGSATTNGGDAA